MGLGSPQSGWTRMNSHLQVFHHHRYASQDQSASGSGAESDNCFVFAPTPLCRAYGFAVFVRILCCVQGCMSRCCGFCLDCMDVVLRVSWPTALCFSSTGTMWKGDWWKCADRQTFLILNFMCYILANTWSSFRFWDRSWFYWRSLWSDSLRAPCSWCLKFGNGPGVNDRTHHCRYTFFTIIIPHLADSGTPNWVFLPQVFKRDINLSSINATLWPF